MQTGITGSVRNQLGHPVTDAVVEIMDAENNVVAKTKVSLNEAIFKFSLPVGKYRVVARHSKYDEEFATVEVKSESLGEVNILLSSATDKEPVSVTIKGRNYIL